MQAAPFIRSIWINIKGKLELVYQAATYKILVLVLKHCATSSSSNSMSSNKPFVLIAATCNILLYLTGTSSSINSMSSNKPFVFCINSKSSNLCFCLQMQTAHCNNYNMLLLLLAKPVSLELLNKCCCLGIVIAIAPHNSTMRSRSFL